MTTITLIASDADRQHLRGEFLDMPGLLLTVEQVARLLDLHLEDSAALLASLEDEGFLLHGSGGAYRRAFPSMA